jgi:hypothetical protein
VMVMVMVMVMVHIIMNNTKKKRREKERLNSLLIKCYDIDLFVGVCQVVVEHLLCFRHQ